MDILVKPMQRLTKYSLLLKAIHKKTENEHHKPELVEMASPRQRRSLRRPEMALAQKIPWRVFMRVLSS